MAELTPREQIRYARHLVLEGVGPEGQARLSQARVLVVGAGGLGSPALLYLAAAGVGTIGIVEFDRVDLSNLQRQILHDTEAVAGSKLDSARKRLGEMNPEVQVDGHEVPITRENARKLVSSYDVVIDGSDNFPTRYLVNDACVLEGVPFVYGAVLQWEGQVSLFGAPNGPCYRCLFREPPPAAQVQNCAQAGVFGALPGVIGSMQALEAIKWILGDHFDRSRSLAGRLLLFDAATMGWREIAIRRDSACPVCGDAPSVTELIDYEVFCGASRDGVPLSGDSGEPGVGLIGAEDLKKALSDEHPPLIVDVRERWEWEIGSLAPLGAVNIPLAEIESGAGDLPDRDVILVCSYGARSHAAVLHLAASGRPGARHLKGGLRAWRDIIDPDLEVV